MKKWVNCVGIVCMFLTMSSFALPQLTIIHKNDGLRLSEAVIHQLVYEALAREIEKESITEGSVFVYSKQEGKENFFVVKLAIPHTFGLKIYRLDLFQSKIVNIISDYVEQEEPIDPAVCGTCPDPEVKVVYAYITQFTTTKPEVDKVTTALTSAGVKHFVLKNNEESKTSILNWLSCPKLVLYGRVAHGSATAIQFGINGAGGSISASEFAKSPYKEVVKGKFYPFNSCYVGGKSTTFAKSMLSAGATWLCGGDNVVLQDGSSEPVWAKFMIDVCAKNLEVIASFNKYMKNAPDKWAYQSVETGPFYPFKDPTAMGNLASSTVLTGLFSLSVTRNAVNFVQIPGTITIYSLDGTFIHSITSTNNYSTWNIGSSHSGVSSGAYIAVLKSTTYQTMQKTFSLVK